MSFLQILEQILEVTNWMFTGIFLVEAVLQLLAFGFIGYFKQKYYDRELWWL